jgi:hypothetical protein
MLGLLLGLGTYIQPIDYIAPNSSVYAETIEYTKDEVKAQIEALGGEYSDVLLAIAEVESNFNPNARNPESTATGLFQFTQDTWNEKCNGIRTNIKDSTLCAKKLLEQGQYYRWESSITKWLPKLSQQRQIDIVGYECSCIAYMRELGHDFPKVPDPSYLEPNSPPKIGGLVLLDYTFPHIGEIIDFRPEVLFFKERVLLNGRCLTRINHIRYDNPNIRGFLI